MPLVESLAILGEAYDAIATESTARAKRAESFRRRAPQIRRQLKIATHNADAPLSVIMSHIKLKQRITMRLLVLFILGAVLGGAVAMLAMNAQQQRSAYPRGVMAVLQNDLGRLRDITKMQPCDVSKSSALLQRLRNATQEIEPALYPNAEVDSTFHRYAEKLRNTLDQSMAIPVSDCPALSKNVAAIGEHCDNCHREFR